MNRKATIELEPRNEAFPLLEQTNLLPLSPGERPYLEKSMEDDETFRYNVVAFNTGYEDLGNDPSERQITDMLAEDFFEPLIERISRWYDNRLQSDDCMHVAITFCAYLDQVLPISNEDTVTPRAAPEDNKLYWIDYVLNRAMNQRRIRNRPQSEKLEAELEDYNHETRHAKWRDIAQAVGGAAVIAASETFLSHDAAGIPAILGALLAARGGLGFAARALSRDKYRDAIKYEQRTEALRLLLPALDVPHGLEHAVKGMQLACEALKLEDDAREHRGFDLQQPYIFPESWNIERLMQHFSYQSGSSSLEARLASAVLDICKNREYGILLQGEATQIAFLNEHLPLKPRSGGPQQWEDYIQNLTEDKDLHRRLDAHYQYPWVTPV